MYLFKNLDYLWMVIFIMISAGLAKEYSLFAPAFAYVRSTFRSNKFVLVILSIIGGILPIEGRVTISAGLIDTIAPKDGRGREKLGIVDYLATHHYYMWSPLEKTVILPIAAFGLTYSQWLAKILPLLLVSIAYIVWYIWTQVKDEELHIAPASFKLNSVVLNVFPMFLAIGAYIAGENMIFCFLALAAYYILITQCWSLRKINSYIKWDAISVIAIVIVLGNFVKNNSQSIESYIKTTHLDIHTFSGVLLLSILAFTTSFFMGSSGKFVAIAVMLSQLFGTQYFLWFFAIDFAAYLVSPTHKCVAIGNRYFNTPLTTYYKALGTWGILLLIVSGLLTFV